MKKHGKKIQDNPMKEEVFYKKEKDQDWFAT